MATALFTATAHKDLQEIWDHVAEHSVSRADAYIVSIGDKCQLLADNPGLGRIRRELGIDTRSFPCANHLIYYRPVPEGVEVLRVLHAARDVPTAWQSWS